MSYLRCLYDGVCRIYVVCMMVYVVFTLFVCWCMSYLRCLCLFAYSVVQHILFLFYFSSSCVPYIVGFSGLSFVDCPFSNIYLNTRYFQDTKGVIRTLNQRKDNTMAKRHQRGNQNLKSKERQHSGKKTPKG